MDGMIRRTEVELIAQLRRDGRAGKAAQFRREYTYGPGFEGRTCIWPSGVSSWLENSSGIMWIGVHGNNSICVVTKASNLDVTRAHNSLIFHTKEAVLQRFMSVVISELEDLADRSSELRKRLDPTIHLPFAVVSGFPVTPDTKLVHKGSVYKASSDEQGNVKIDEVIKNILENENIAKQDPDFRKVLHGYDKTIMYLQNNMATNNDAIQAPTDMVYDEDAKRFLVQKIMKKEVFTNNETIQIAISAFQRLFKKEFKADEIQVSLMDPKYFVPCKDAYIKDIYVKHLERGEIEPHLAAINHLGSGEIKQHFAVIDNSGNGGNPPPNKRMRPDNPNSREIID